VTGEPKARAADVGAGPRPGIPELDAEGSFEGSSRAGPALHEDALRAGPIRRALLPRAEATVTSRDNLPKGAPVHLLGYRSGRDP